MRSLRLKNFRSLIDTGRIELRPLTLLVGANNSGKSSFLRFFPLLRQTYEARSASPLLWYGRDVDFADFSHVMRRGADPSEIEIDLEIDLALVFDGHAVKRGPPVLTQFTITLHQHEDKTQLRRCVVTRDNQSYDLMLDRAQELERFTANGVDVLSQAPGWRPQISTDQLIPNFNPESELFEDLPPPGSSLGRALVGGARNGAPLDERLKTVGTVPDILWWSGLELARYAKGIAYISPFRAHPQRLYRVQEVSVTHIDPNGENLAMFLRALPGTDRRFLHLHGRAPGAPPAPRDRGEHGLYLPRERFRAG
jgi:AAA ATPase domain